MIIKRKWRWSWSEHCYVLSLVCTVKACEHISHKHCTFDDTHTQTHFLTISWLTVCNSLSSHNVQKELHPNTIWHCNAIRLEDHQQWGPLGQTGSSVFLQDKTSILKVLLEDLQLAAVDVDIITGRLLFVMVRPYISDLTCFSHPHVLTLKIGFLWPDILFFDPKPICLLTLALLPPLWVPDSRIQSRHQAHTFHPGSYASIKWMPQGSSRQCFKLL